MFFSAGPGEWRVGDRGELQRGRGWARPSPLEFTFLLFLFSFVRRNEGVFSFSFVRRIIGRRSPGTPHYDRASWSGVGKGYLEKRTSDKRTNGQTGKRTSREIQTNGETWTRSNPNSPSHGRVICYDGPCRDTSSFLPHSSPRRSLLHTPGASS